MKSNHHITALLLLAIENAIEKTVDVYSDLVETVHQLHPQGIINANCTICLKFTKHSLNTIIHLTSRLRTK
jgi:hypothetical protein